jgi:hypothetical protein
MAREDAKALHKEFVTVKVDIDRMTGGKEVLASYPKSEKQGIPWFVFLQPDGKELADSMGPNGNIGCPNADDEIETFLAILKRIAVNLTEDDLAALRKSLFAAQVKTK